MVIKEENGMSEYTHLLFDLDGTITDSEPGIINCIKYALDRYGFDYRGVDLNKYLGPPLKLTFAELLGEDNASAAIDVYRERFRTKGIFENSLYGGITDMLSALKAQGYILSIATSKPEEYAIIILEYFHVADLFSYVTGSLLDNTRQDKAEVIEYAINRAGCTKNSCLMIGDRNHDLLGAEKVGIDAMGVLYGYGSYEELSLCKSVFLAEKPEDVIKYLC